jgi:UrcA family protein
MHHNQLRALAKPLLLAGVAALFISSAPHAFAAERDFQKGSSVKVKFGDLNLGSAGDVQVLYQRIEKAARRVCNEDAEPGDPRWHSHWRYCYKTAVANAVRDVNNQRLTAMYQQKNGQGPVG